MVRRGEGLSGRRWSGRIAMRRYKSARSRASGMLGEWVRRARRWVQRGDWLYRTMTLGAYLVSRITCRIQLVEPQNWPLRFGLISVPIIWKSYR